MRIDLSGHKFVFPQRCACCGGMPQTTLSASASRSTGKRVVHTTTKSWDFPYCHKCVAHVRAAKGATIVAMIVGIAAVFFGGIVYLAWEVPILGVILSVA